MRRKLEVTVGIGIELPEVHRDRDFASAVGGIDNMSGEGQAGKVGTEAGHDLHFFF